MTSPMLSFSFAMLNRGVVMGRILAITSLKLRIATNKPEKTSTESKT